jgi:hypothetical protein
VLYQPVHKRYAHRLEARAAAPCLNRPYQLWVSPGISHIRKVALKILLHQQVTYHRKIISSDRYQSNFDVPVGVAMETDGSAIARSAARLIASAAQATTQRTIIKTCGGCISNSTDTNTSLPRPAASSSLNSSSLDTLSNSMDRFEPPHQLNLLQKEGCDFSSSSDADIDSAMVHDDSNLSNNKINCSHSYADHEHDDDEDDDDDDDTVLYFRTSTHKDRAASHSPLSLSASRAPADPPLLNAINQQQQPSTTTIPTTTSTTTTTAAAAVTLSMYEAPRASTSAAARSLDSGIHFPSNMHFRPQISDIMEDFIGTTGGDSCNDPAIFDLSPIDSLKPSFVFNASASNPGNPYLSNALYPQQQPQQPPRYSVEGPSSSVITDLSTIRFGIDLGTKAEVVFKFIKNPDQAEIEIQILRLLAAHNVPHTIRLLNVISCIHDLSFPDDASAESIPQGVVLVLPKLERLSTRIPDLESVARYTQQLMKVSGGFSLLYITSCPLLIAILKFPIKKIRLSKASTL